MNTCFPQKFKTILIGVAFSPNLQNNIFEAMRLVDFFDCNLVIVHVGEKTKEKEKTIKHLLSGIVNEGNEKVKMIWKEGNPVEVIIEASKNTRADLIMLGAIPKEDILKFYIGSIARKIVRKAPCSVLLLIKPSEDLRPCRHIVVNGLKSNKTLEALTASFEFAQNLGSNQLTIVEEISQKEVKVVVRDNQSLLKSTLKKEQLTQKQALRLRDVLKKIPEHLKNTITIKIQPIFGKRGYSIGHYAKVVGADLLIMNAPEKNTFLDRIFPHDMEYILSELPTDVLIVR
ncbi:universal stress protein [Aquimarina sp. W85]|uniref:universal stress protein n=1 Tax=Aquimarina rhodophyticola TaxID=3342246 RepID=UPI00366EF2F7